MTHADGFALVIWCGGVPSRGEERGLTVADNEAAQHEAVCYVDEGDHVAQHHGSADGCSRPENGDGCLVDQAMDQEEQEEPALATPRITFDSTFCPSVYAGWPRSLGDDCSPLFLVRPQCKWEGHMHRRGFHWSCYQVHCYFIGVVERRIC